MSTEINLNTINIEQLASILDVSIASIYSDLSRAPSRIPQPVERGRRTHLIWMEVVVFEWLMERSKHANQGSHAKSTQPKIGRPKKIRSKELNHGI